QIGRNRACIDRDEGMVSAWRIGVERLGNQLFAGSTFTLQQDRRAAGRDLGDKVEEAKHGFAFADNIFEVVALFESSLKLYNLFLGPVSGDSCANVSKQLFVVPGFLDEVLRTRANGINHIADGSVGCDHNDRQVGVHLDDSGQKVNAALSRQREVEQEQIVVVACEQIEP